MITDAFLRIRNSTRKNWRPEELAVLFTAVAVCWLTPKLLAKIAPKMPKDACNAIGIFIGVLVTVLGYFIVDPLIRRSA